MATVTAMGGIALATPGHAEPTPSLDEVQSQVDDLYHKAEQATERYNAATDKLTEVQRRIERAQAAVTKQEAKVADATASLASFASASYQVGGMDPTLRTLLAEDPAEFMTQASVLDAYADQQVAKLDHVAAERRGLEQSKLLADEELARLTAIEQELETEKATVEQYLADAQAILDGLEEDERQRLEEEAAARERERQESEDTPDRSDTTEEPVADVPASGKGAIAVEFAMAQLGEPYLWGGNGPDAWDCSGLTVAAWAEAGVSLPRSSGSQISVGTRVSKSQLQPGDLVFYYSPISHVGIYIGGGEIVHATHPGDVVSVDPVDLMPFAGATRPG
jgi:cell wall-associated NlpC family hydrolase